jgi:hypothetical protein
MGPACATFRAEVAAIAVEVVSTMDTGAVVISPAGTCDENIQRPETAREKAD